MKITKTIIWGLLVAAWLSGANAWAQANPHEQGAMSVRKLDDGLYYMEYEAGPATPPVARRPVTGLPIAWTGPLRYGSPATCSGRTTPTGIPTGKATSTS